MIQPLCIQERSLILKLLTAVFLFTVLNSFACIAQTSEQYRACNNGARTQSEMNVCASEEAASMDARLNQVYEELLSQTANHQEAIAKIKAAERAWLIYRDAYIDAMYPAKDKQTEYGSVYPMEVDLLRAKLAQLQVDALEEMLRRYRRE